MLLLHFFKVFHNILCQCQFACRFFPRFLLYVVENDEMAFVNGTDGVLIFRMSQFLFVTRSVTVSNPPGY